MKKHFLLASILGSSLSIFPPAVEAQQGRVAHAKAQLQEYEKKFGTQNDIYCSMLLSLAEAYLFEGNKKDANKYFQLAQTKAEKRQNGKALIINQKIRWANSLFASSSTDKENRAEAISLLHDYENYLDQNNGQINDYLNIASWYHSARELSEQQKIESKIQDKLDASAKTQTSKGKLTSIMYAYLTLGSMHVAKKNRQFIGMASDKAELDKASVFFQKVLELCERLPEKDGYAIDMYRKIAQFYKANGKTELAAKYTTVLSKALGSSDPSVLFPPVDLCPACGRG